MNLFFYSRIEKRVIGHDSDTNKMPRKLNLYSDAVIGNDRIQNHLDHQSTQQVKCMEKKVNKVLLHWLSWYYIIHKHSHE